MPKMAVLLSLTVFIVLVLSSPLHTTTAARVENLEPYDQAESSSTVKLSNGSRFPLIGVGVGNLAHDRITTVLRHALRDVDGKGGGGYRLVDTARASRNEREVADGVEGSVLGENGRGDERSAGLTTRTKPRDDARDDPDAVHVITKVWYTHLGYDRTVLSVKESISDLILPYARAKIKIHVLLHWPMCDDAISWMDCAGEEERLPQYVKDAGSPPHLNKEHAWKESWKALEDLYRDDKTPLESIGVSNFNTAHMREIFEGSRVGPHIFQGNVWAVVHDPDLMNLLRKHDVFFQAYNVMNGVVGRGNVAPNAHGVLERTGKSLAKRVQGEGREAFTPAQVVLAFLTQQNVGVIPRAASLTHQDDNSPSIISSIPTLNNEEQINIEASISALLKGQDIPPTSQHVSATFVNNLHESHGPARVFWSNEQTGEEVPVSEGMERGGKIMINTHPGHVFVAYSEDRSLKREFRVDNDYGEHAHFNIEL